MNNPSHDPTIIIQCPNGPPLIMRHEILFRNLNVSRSRDVLLSADLFIERNQADHCPKLLKFTEFPSSTRVATFSFFFTFLFLCQRIEGQVTLNSADSFEGNILDGGYCIQYSTWIQIQIGSLSRTQRGRVILDKLTIIYNF